jgi:hypothetical protein
MKLLDRSNSDVALRFMEQVWKEAKGIHAKELQEGVKQVVGGEAWKIPEDPTVTATKNSEILLSYPIVREAIQAARHEVAAKNHRQPEEVYYRIVQVDDFNTVNGATPIAGQFEFNFTNGSNFFTISNVGDRFEKIVLIGLLVTDIKDFVSNVRVVINGNRLKDYPAAFVKAAQGDWFLLPEGPIIIHERCRFQLEINLVGLPTNGVLRGRAFPLAIGFPIGV